MSRNNYAASRTRSYTSSSCRHQQAYRERNSYPDASYTSSWDDRHGPRVKTRQFEYGRIVDYSSDDEGSRTNELRIARRLTYSEDTRYHSTPVSVDSRPLVIRTGPSLPSSHSNSGGLAVEGAVVGALGLAVAYGGMYVAAASVEAATATAAMTIPVAIAALLTVAAATVTGGAAYVTWQGALASRRCFEPYIRRALRESRVTADVIRTIAEVKARDAALLSVGVAAASVSAVVSTGGSVAGSSAQVSASLVGRVSGALSVLRGTTIWGSTAHVEVLDDAASAVTIPLEENEWEAIEMQSVEAELVLESDLREEDVWNAMGSVYEALNERKVVWEVVKDTMSLQMKILGVHRERRATAPDAAPSQEEADHSEEIPAAELEGGQTHGGTSVQRIGVASEAELA